MYELAADDIHMWTIALDDAGVEWRTLEILLLPAERERAACFTRDDLRRRYVISHAALNYLLCDYLGLPTVELQFEIEKNGKPGLAKSINSSDLRFNLTHSGEIALVALARGCEIGVDVEHRHEVRHRAELADRYFAASEIAAINSAAEATADAAFLTTWTMKEAVLKGMGLGIGFPLHKVNVDITAELQRVMVDDTTHREHSQWWLRRLSVNNDSVAAIATSVERPAPQIKQFEMLRLTCL